ncbi:hypothetical protein VFPBJ_01735 [Purpureocillium lilacinum]|uniref:Uncharacterized protein n=1 Tax=Purpureocillium lilacinum TaxID=33203 RepID=A0A179HBK3_PURLI|nr:hypothetical protein VFPBJ_01735 [Purpureocillium lilacinum]
MSFTGKQWRRFVDIESIYLEAVAVDAKFFKRLVQDDIMADNRGSIRKPTAEEEERMNKAAEAAKQKRQENQERRDKEKAEEAAKKAKDGSAPQSRGGSGSSSRQ